MEEQLDQKTDKDQHEMEDQLKRALADYANLKKRVEKEKAEFVKFSNESLLLQLLGILDGMELAVKEFRTLLKHYGFEQVPVKPGEKFDPEKMEALEQNENGERVVEVYSSGYKLHDKLVRPAKVKVGDEQKSSY